MLAYIKALIIQFEPTLNKNNIDAALSGHWRQISKPALTPLNSVHYAIFW